MKADRSEMIRCADTSDAPTDHGLAVTGWGIVHRAYMDTTKQDSSGGRFPGTTLAAAMVPMPLTPMSPRPRLPTFGFRRFPAKVTGFAAIAAAREGLWCPVGTQDRAPLADGHAAGQPGPLHEAHAALPAHGSGPARAAARRMDGGGGRREPARAAHGVHRRARRQAHRRLVLACWG